MNVAHRDPPRIAFLFTGRGAQYTGIKAFTTCRGCSERHSIRCAAILQPYLDRPLLDVLFTKDAGAAQINQTRLRRSLRLFAVEFALTELWRSWGVTPTAVIGHSVGEYRGLRRGVFSLQDGLRLVALQGSTLQSLPTGGAMAAVFFRKRSLLR